MQHDVYENIFALGDCTNLPTSKTAAGITSQHKIVAQNITNIFKGKELRADYDGYTRKSFIFMNIHGVVKPPWLEEIDGDLHGISDFCDFCMTF